MLTVAEVAPVANWNLKRCTTLELGLNAKAGMLALEVEVKAKVELFSSATTILLNLPPPPLPNAPNMLTVESALTFTK